MSAHSTYREACKIWAKADYWTIEDGVKLLLGIYPDTDPNSHSDVSEELVDKYHLYLSLADNCLGVSLPVVKLGNIHTSSPRVRVKDFIAWAEQKSLHIPTTLESAVREYSKLRSKRCKTNLNQWGIMKHRCRGIASILWNEDSSISLDEMSKHEKIIAYGCNISEATPEQSTIKKWIKDLNPNKS